MFRAKPCPFLPFDHVHNHEDIFAPFLFSFRVTPLCRQSAGTISKGGCALKTSFYVKTIDATSAQLLDSILSQIYGVRAIEVDLAQRKVTVEFVPDRAGPVGIRAVAAAAGFSPSDVPIETVDANADDRRSASYRWKRMIGGGLFAICETFPTTKAALRRFGMRAKKEWLRDRAGHIQTPAGETFKLASIGENYLSFQVFWKGSAFYEPITRRHFYRRRRQHRLFLDPLGGSEAGSSCRRELIRVAILRLSRTPKISDS